MLWILLTNTSCLEAFCIPSSRSPLQSYGSFRDGDPVNQRAPFTVDRRLFAINNPNQSSSLSDNKDAPISRRVKFSVIMTLSGAILGPFLDSYHSAFGVLQYDSPIGAVLWGSADYPALTTTWWVPPLFGVAGFLIGWLYILLDDRLETPTTKRLPSVPKILIGISFFTLQYWLSGVFYSSGIMDRTTIFNIMSVLATAGYGLLDGTVAGGITSAATAVGGPLIEMGLIGNLNTLVAGSGYQYTDLGETGFFPLWIAPIYFLGGPAVGNLARGVMAALDPTTQPTTTTQSD